MNLAHLRAGEYAQRFQVDEDAMAELVGSVKRRGVLQPLLVRKEGDVYVVVGGHRRFEAAKRAGRVEVPCLVVEGEENELREVTFAENFFRRDLSPVELACAIAEEYQSGRMTVEQLAAGFRRSPDWIKRQVSVTQWPEDVLEAMHSGDIGVGAGASLAQVEEDAYRKFLIRNAVESGVTTRTAASWLQAWRTMQPGEAMEQVNTGQSEGPVLPAMPQGVCLKCRGMRRMDELSHVPLCVECVRVLNR